MSDVKKKYINILRIELKDLEQDIAHLIQKCEKEKQESNLPPYIYLENLALFKNELLGLSVFDQILDDVQPDSFTSLEEMIEYLKKRCHEKIDAHGLAEAVNNYVDRRLQKVAKYVEN